MRRTGLILALLSGLVLLLAGGGAVYLSRAELAPQAARLASGMLGRAVTLGSLQLDIGLPIRIVLRDLAIANADWARAAGSRAPEMLRLDHLEALVDVGSLLRGVLRYDHLAASGLRVMLERDDDRHGEQRVGNWAFPGFAAEPGRPAPAGGLALVPQNRTQFPSLPDFILRDGLITYRTSAGNDLRIGLREAVIRAKGEDAPVLLNFDGSYNGTALRLQGRTASFDVLRDATRPFEAAFSIEGANLRADFGGLIDRPLDFDAVQGRLQLEASLMSALLRLFGSEARAALPLKLAGSFSRDGDAWRLDDAHGALSGQDFTGRLALTEQSAGQGDIIDAALTFPELSLDPLLAGLNKSGSDAPDSWQLDTDPAGARVTVALDAARLRYREWRAETVSAEMRLKPGEAALPRFALMLGGGKLQGSATARARGEDTHILASASLMQAEAAKLAALLGAEDKVIAGRVTARALVEMSGGNAAEALRVSRGHLVAIMEDGSVARTLLEQASTDLRALFRSRDGFAALDCLLGVATLQNGQVAVTPLRLHAQRTQLSGGGLVDLLQQKLDLVLRSNSNASGFFALDIPLRFQGPFGDIRVRPTGAKAALPVLDAQVALQALPPALQQMARGSSCAAP